MRYPMLAVVLGACVVSKQYTLKLDARNPSENKLCERASDEDPAKASTPACRYYSGQSFDSPSTLAITIEHADPAREYVARVEQTSRGPSGDDASAVFHETLKRLKDWTAQAVKGAGTEKDVADAQVGVLQQVGQDLAQRGIEAGSRHVVGLMPASPASAPRPDARALFGEPGGKDTGTYLIRTADGKTTLAIPELAAEIEPVLGMPSTPYPAPRSAVLEDGDVAYLEKHLAANTARKALAQFMLDVCAPASFGSEPYTGKNTAWKDYLASVDPTNISGKDILDDLGVNQGDVLAFLQGKAKLDIEKVLRDSRRRAAAAIKAGQRPERVDASVHQLYLFSRLHRDTRMCATNIAFATGLVAGDAALVKKLNETRTALDGLASRTRSAAAVFAAVFEPYIRRTVVQLLEGSGEQTLNFGAFSVAPGTVSVAVTERSSGETRDIATYELKVQRASLVSVSIGPMVTLCRSCIKHVSEQTEAGAMEGDEGKRILQLENESYAYSLATMVNFAIATKAWFQLAGGIGYPVSNVSNKGGLEKGALVGVTLRHRVGFGISAGLHLFEGQRLKDGYGPRIDTSQPGFVGLTADDVVETSAQAAFYVSASIDSGILEKVF